MADPFERVLQLEQSGQLSPTQKAALNELRARGRVPPAMQVVPEEEVLEEGPVVVPTRADTLKRSPLDWATDFLSTSAQGPTAGFLDEIVTAPAMTAMDAAIRTVRPDLLDPGSENATLGQLYQKNLNKTNQRIEDFEYDYPATSFLGQAAMTLPMAIAAAPAAARTIGSNAYKQTLGKVPALLKVPAASGASAAAYGYGSGETPDERVDQATTYGAVGTLAGPAMIGLGNLAGKGYGALSNALGLNSVVKEGAGVVSSAMSGLKNIPNKAAKLVGLGDFGAKPIAERKVLKALTEDLGVDDSDAAVVELQRYLAKNKKPISIAEVPDDGGAARQLGETINQFPGPQQEKASSFFHDRQRGVEDPLVGVKDSQSQRILSDLQPLLGKESYKDAMKKLIENRSANAAPLYEKLNDVEVELTPELLGYFKRLPREAFAYANSLAKMEGKAGINMPQISKALESIANGEPAELPMFNLSQLDLIKQGMDDYVSAAYSKGQRGVPGAAKKLKDEYLTYLDELSPDYKAAREAYAGPSAIKTAMERGTEILQKEFNPEDIAGMTASEKDALKIGAYQAIKDVLETTKRGTNKGEMLIQNERLLQRFGNLFDDPEEFNTFVSGLKKESAMTGWGQKVLGGSPTAKRIKMQEDFEEDNIAQGFETIAKAATGRFSMTDGLLSGLRKIVGDVNKYVASETGDILFKKFDQQTLDTLKNRIAADKELSAAQRTQALNYINQASAAIGDAKLEKE
jgi:hypothetical protein